MLFFLNFIDFFCIFDYILLFQENFSLINNMEEISILKDSSCDETAPTAKMRMEGLLLFISVVFLYYAVSLGPSYMNTSSTVNTISTDSTSNTSVSSSTSLSSIPSHNGLIEMELFKEIKRDNRTWHPPHECFDLHPIESMCQPHYPKPSGFKPGVNDGGLILDEVLED